MYQSHVYLEVRILLSAAEKFFVDNVGSKNSSDSKKEISAANVNLNVVKKVCVLADALGCKMHPTICFERLTGNLAVPERFNLSLYSLLLGENGTLNIEFHRRKKAIKIETVRLEEDAGRLTHQNGKSSMDYTFVGCPCIRIKTGANFELGEEAELFLVELRRLIQYLGIVDDIAIEQRIRCNAYAALAEYPEDPSYYIKLRNLNSFNFVRKAVNSEITRQEEILVSGGIVKSESRLWNERQNLTEFYQDRTSTETRQFESVENSIPFDMPELSVSCAELPEIRRERFCRDFGLSRMRADFICDDKDRADFFEETISFGADPMDTAHWMMSEVAKLVKRKGLAISQTALTTKKFAEIIKMLKAGQIHSGIAKQLLQAVISTGDDPAELVRKNNMMQIVDENKLLPIVREVIAENPVESEKLRQGEMPPLEFLTGLVMKKTSGRALPQIVKSLLKKELKISIVYILAMGGAISSRHSKNGTTLCPDEQVISEIISSGASDVRCQVIPLSKMLSEDLEPADWAILISEISSRIAAGTASGIVVPYGTSTLSYTAALLFWLFSDANVPIILTASSHIPEESDEAKINLLQAIQTAAKMKNGVFVVFGGKVLSPLNLKFDRLTADGFSNWNLKEPCFENSGPLANMFSGIRDVDAYVLTQLLREAADAMLLCPVYPGLRADRFASLIDEGVTTFFLELYGIGTGSMRSSGFSLKPLLQRGRKRGCRFYCTSQQENCIDFSSEAATHRVWREGAVPMGHLTTESTIALYFAASLLADNQEELDQYMESYAELYS